MTMGAGKRVEHVSGDRLLSLRFRHHSRTHYVEQMEALQGLVRAM